MHVVRAACAALLFAVSPITGAAPCAGFTDVDDASAFCANVEWIKNRGVTLGCTATQYCPAANVSRLTMAAFLNRLGDALLPPRVVWVAKEGGTYASVQAAIDAVAPMATATTPYLVKVAPGVYDGTVTMAPYVDVEGSGENVTTLRSTSCFNSPSATGTVIAASHAQLRRVDVLNVGTDVGTCPAVVVSDVDGVVLRDVAVHVLPGSTEFHYGILMLGSTGSPVIDRVEIVNHHSMAIRVARSFAAPRAVLRQIKTHTQGPTALAGLWVEVGKVAVVDSWMAASGISFGTVTTTGNASQADVWITNSHLSSTNSGNNFAVNQLNGIPSAVVRIAHSVIEGVLAGGPFPICFSVANGTFGAATCS